tara:strand:+ start:4616 stop:4882 length:267 start_codon:yes stop_codon:yes gene_type:complete
MYDIHDIEQGKTYACKFKIEIMLDTLGRPMGIDDTPFDAPGLYEGIGVIKIRDIENKQVQVVDEKTGKEFVLSFDDIWDVDDAVIAND